MVPLRFTATQEKPTRINILKLIEPTISIMFSINRLKQSFSNMIVTKTQLIAVNAGGELLVELLRKIEMEKLPLKKILKTFRLDHVSDHLWRLTYSYKKEDVVMEKSDR